MDEFNDLVTKLGDRLERVAVAKRPQGQFQGLTDLEWRLFSDLFTTPEAALPHSGRGKPPVTCRAALNSLLYWYLYPGGTYALPPYEKNKWCGRSILYPIYERWLELGLIEQIKGRILELINNPGLMRWAPWPIDTTFWGWPQAKVAEEVAVTRLRGKKVVRAIQKQHAEG